MLISNPVLETVPLKVDWWRGDYPITHLKNDEKGLTVGWHGGAHVIVGHGTAGDYLVRAIADGEVVAYRVPTPKPEGKTSEELEKLPLGYGGWTDDGFVILKHEKECGQDRKVVFFSLYMHLSQLEPKDLKGSPGQVQCNPKDAKTGAPLKLLRKTPLGKSGRIYDQDGRLHFEILMDDGGFKAFFEQSDGTKPTEVGKKDPWGDLYFVVPAGQPYFREKPGVKEQPKVVGKTPVEYRIALNYRDGSACYRLLDDHGEKLESWTDSGAEYGLYSEAKGLDKGKQSRAYELMRFARFMTWDDVKDDPKPAPAHCWRYMPMVNGWVDLADDAVVKLSDADFPKWAWEIVDEGKAGFDPSNNQCTVSELLTAIDANGDGQVAETEFEGWLNHPGNEALLQRLVVKFTSEWDDAKADERWGWVKKAWESPKANEVESLERRKVWVTTQQTQCQKGLDKLKERLQSAKDWLGSLDKIKGEADAAMEQVKADVKEAAEGRKNLVNLQGQAKVDESKRLKELEAGATSRKAKAEGDLKWLGKAMGEAKAWQAREEMKLKAAQDVIDSAPKELEKLEASITKAEEAAQKEAQDPDAQKRKDQAGDDFKAFRAHMDALMWWKDVKGADKALASSSVWHVHPLAFIEYFKRCHWLSKDELVAVYGWWDPQKPNSPEAAKNRKDREIYRLALNRAMWKYGITTPTRMAHFLGQGGHESGTLLLMAETADGSKYEFKPNLGNVRAGDGPLFKGRGMKQLTGCFNYVQYWVYRGWLEASWLGKVWYKVKSRNKEGKTTWVEPKDEPPTLTKPAPGTCETVAFTCIDTGAWFWEARGGQPVNPEQKDGTGVWFYGSRAHHQSINSLFVEGQMDDKTIDKISDAINPGEEGDSEEGSGDHALSDARLRRRPRTWHVWNALHDRPEPLVVDDNVGKTAKAKSKSASSKKPAGQTPKPPGKPAHSPHAQAIISTP